MKTNELTILEIKALLRLFEENLNEEQISNYDNHMAKKLFLVYLKLNKAKNRWEEAMAYTE